MKNVRKGNVRSNVLGTSCSTKMEWDNFWY